MISLVVIVISKHWSDKTCSAYTERKKYPTLVKEDNWMFYLFRRLILAIKSELAFYDSVLDSVNTIVGIKTSLESHWYAVTLRWVFFETEYASLIKAAKLPFGWTTVGHC